MRFRKSFKKWLYGRCPGLAGSFPYHGVRTYFPKDSLIFRLACEQGIYEAQNVRVLLSALRPNTTCFDLGANIGLMALPLLGVEPTLRVVSAEPSPQTHACLARTARESVHAPRWETLPVATGDHEGEIEFYCSAPAFGAFDGVTPTGRGGATTQIKVPLTTVDRLWIERGRPAVSVIKIDVEGAELASLHGARECLRATRPLVLVEWCQDNLNAFGIPPEHLLTVAAEMDYGVYAMPLLARTDHAAQLRAQMRFEESFVLLPLP